MLLSIIGLLLSCRARREPEGGEAKAPGTSSPAAAPDAALTPASREGEPLADAAAPPAGEPANPALGGKYERRAEREALFDTIARESGIEDQRVLGALKRVPRHRFVPEALASEAYANRPLPIGEGQTISQPTIVAVMTAVVEPHTTDKCLEIGTGSGYQAAVLAELCQKVWSIEYHAPLARFAEQNLRGAGYGPERVALRIGDGYRGWPDEAPFDVIVVTAAPDQVPPPLLDQLAVGGRLVIPVGREDGPQELELWLRRAPGKGAGAFEQRRLMGVRFVPFLGEGKKP